MSNYHIRTEARVAHPQNAGVWLKHFFSSADNDRLNNAEVTIDPGAEIAPHIHEAATEFFYVVRGTGAALLDGAWVEIAAGDAMKAPTGTTHCLRNTGAEPLVLLVTFTPPTR